MLASHVSESGSAQASLFCLYGRALTLSQSALNCVDSDSMAVHTRWMTIAVVALFAAVVALLAYIIRRRARIAAAGKDPREQARRALAFHAYHDTLTGLPNRAYLMHQLQAALADAERAPLALMFIDLDGFKAINDSLGHEAGDTFLRAVASSLRASVRQRDTVSRFGGDEFVVVLHSYGGMENLIRICRKVLDLVSHPVTVSGQLVAVSPSIGIAISPRDGNDAEMLLRNADAAMYAVKETGKADFRFYKEGMHELARERVAMTLALREALQRGVLRVEYQPKRNLRTGALAGVEALARWYDETRGEVPPTIFVAVAERTGLIHALGEYVLRTVLAQLIEWDAIGLRVDYVAINLSLHELSRPTFVDTLHRMVRSCGVDPIRIRFELTESSAMRQPEETLRQLRELRGHGFKLLIDDFGAGYWNLGHLRELPADTIKIDQSFVRGSGDSHADREITEAIIGLAKKLNLETVAEGVETEAQAEWLRALGCDIGQGYYFARPMSPEALADYLRPSVAYVD